MSADGGSPVIRVRDATTEDFDRALPLLEAMGNVAADTALVRRRFATLSDDPAHAVFLAEHDGALVGYAWAHDYGPHLRSGKRTARWNDLYVGGEFRRLGAGRSLYEAVRAWAAGRGVTWLQWQASEQALPFYERLGLIGDPCPDPEHPFFEIEF